MRESPPCRADHGPPQGRGPVVHDPVKPLGPVSDLLLGLSFHLEVTASQFNVFVLTTQQLGSLGPPGKLSLQNITGPGLWVQGEQRKDRVAGLGRGRGVDLNQCGQPRGQRQL